MAILYPSMNEIKKLKPYPTEGELALLNKLSKELDDSYNIYFQPFLDGDNPDIVVLKETGGVYIIEVKDWNLESYLYDKRLGSYGEFYLVKDKCKVGNPFKQVTKYKDDIFGMHIEELFMKKEKNRSIFGKLVKVGVYFHKADEYSVKNKFYTNLKDVNFIKKWGYDSNISIDIRNSLDRNCEYMNSKLYKEFHRLFQPAYHSFDEGEYINLTDKQKELATSKPNCSVKIKGVAGSGKTLVLANRAVSATKRTGNKVLILTYNITLINYIKDRISKVREDFSWDRFVILNYHSFISSELRKLGEHDIVDDNSEEHIDNDIKQGTIDVFKRRSSEINKYDTILIDEGQDFEKSWLINIKDNFLNYNGEFVIFADEKQNIYGRKLGDDKKVETNVIGRWNELNKSFRIGNDISKLAMKYQKHFFEGKYEIDLIHTEQMSLFETPQDIKYKFDPTISYIDVFEEVRNYIKENGIHNNNVCIIAMEIEHLRELEYEARHKYNFKFERAIETKEDYDDICKLYNSEEDRDSMLEKLRRIRKKQFYLDRGTMKISTTHSFKGWEIETLVIIIDETDDEASEELIYTALTRCKNNLLIFNRGDRKLDEFFSKNINLQGVVI